MTIRIGELFAGYGGLGAGVQAAIGGRVAWVSDIDPGACAILAHRFPDAPNLGDITTIDWTTVPPVDVLTGGFPCQDLSAAGRRKGMRPGTRSGLWADFKTAIDVLRPPLVVIENVRGLLNGCAETDAGVCLACAEGDLEPDEGRVGDGRHRPVLRALGRVLGDLANLGYDARWQGLRAADVGAPHARFRVFVVAWPAADAGVLGRDRRAGVDGDGRHPAVGGEARGHAGDGGASRAAADAERGSSAERSLPGGGGAEVTGDRRDHGAAADARSRRAATDPDGLGHEWGGGARHGRPGSADGAVTAADADGGGRESVGRGGVPQGRPAGDAARDRAGGAAADTDGAGLEGPERPQPQHPGSAVDDGGAAADTVGGAGERRADLQVGGADRRAAARGDRGGSSGGSAAAADAEGDGRHEGRPEPARLERGPDAPLGGDQTVCNGCGDPVDFHDADGFCAGTCGGNCQDPYFGRPGVWNTDDGAPPAADADDGLLVPLGGELAGGPPRRERSEQASDRGPANRGGGGAAADADGDRREVLERVEPRLGPRSDADRRGPVDWGPYAAAIARWEHAIGRPAPAPTEPAARGDGQRLSPAFVEWMMGLPAGWVTDVPGLTRNNQLKALGNGVVPQQAAHALRLLLGP